MVFAVLSGAVLIDSVTDTRPAQVVQCRLNMQVGGSFESEASYKYVRVELVRIIAEQFWHFLPPLLINNFIINILYNT